MSHTYSFEKLEVWQLSIDFIKDIYVITANFPTEEKFGIISQIRRAAVSISNNIVEGSARNTARDQANFTNTSYASTLEVLNVLIISKELDFLEETKYNLLRKKIEKLTFKLNKFHDNQMQRAKEGDSLKD